MGEGNGCYSQSGAQTPQDQSGHQPALPPGSLYQLGRRHLARRRPPRGEKSALTHHSVYAHPACRAGYTHTVLGRHSSVGLPE